MAGDHVRITSAVSSLEGTVTEVATEGRTVGLFLEDVDKSAVVGDRVCFEFKLGATERTIHRLEPAGES